MTWKEPKVLGFYKEEGDEQFVAELKGDIEGLYVEIPSGFRNRMEIVVGNKARVLLDSIMDNKNGNLLRKIKKEVTCEVVGYWNELHIPLEELSGHRLKKGDVLALVVKSVIQSGVEKKV